MTGGNLCHLGLAAGISRIICVISGHNDTKLGLHPLRLTVKWGFERWF